MKRKMMTNMIHVMEKRLHQKDKLPSEACSVDSKTTSFHLSTECLQKILRNCSNLTAKWAAQPVIKINWTMMNFVWRTLPVVCKQILKSYRNNTFRNRVASQAKTTDLIVQIFSKASACNQLNTINLISWQQFIIN